MADERPKIVPDEAGTFRIEIADMGIAFGLTDAEAEAWVDGWAFAQGGDGWIRQTAHEWSR